MDASQRLINRYFDLQLFQLQQLKPHGVFIDMSITLIGMDGERFNGASQNLTGTTKYS